jgi:hypothetical protein
MYGLFSNRELSDPEVYDDDWIVHTSDQDYMPYYRPLNSLEDTVAMEGNCKHAGAGFGRAAGWKGPPPCLRTPPHLPPWTIGRLRPLLHNPERHRSSVEAFAVASGARLRLPERGEGFLLPFNPQARTRCTRASTRV